MSTPPSSGDLTGVWQCDDGGLYYVRQGRGGSVTWAGLQDSGFHEGMEFTNVFRGALSGDGSFISGEWADVPRGATANAGTITLGIWDDGDAAGLRLERVPEETTGGFGGSTWYPTGSLLEPQDIVDVDGRVQRYDKPLGQNNPPCRDFTVMWGWVGSYRAGPPEGPSLPPDPYNYCSFVNSGRGIWNEVFGWGGDGDFTFDFTVRWDADYPNETDIGDFWNNGWVTQQPSAFSDPPVTHIARLYEKYEIFHCEAAMYGRENSGDECSHKPRNLLPGWNEPSGWSVLVNGRPIEGRLTVENPDDLANRFLSFNVGPGGQSIDLQAGMIARVTGVVADDAGHEGEVPPEIHPLYAIDLLQPFAWERAQPTTLSGVWHGSDSGTYYVRQLDREVWWLGLSRDQGRSFANVFRGSVSESGTVAGQWVDVPMGVGGVLSGGTLILAGDAPDTQVSTTLTKTQETANFGTEVWTKIYDTEGVPVSPLGNAGP
jgi:hypothetical protein